MGGATEPSTDEPARHDAPPIDAPPMTTAAIIPALNEAPTVGDVVRVAAASPLVDDIVVVDGGSGDGTPARARAAGARVIERRGGGKGEAMAAGVAATSADVIVFLDADLIGLATGHVDRLARSVATGGAAMSCGLFDRGPARNRVCLRALPYLTGERAVRRELFTALGPADIRDYRVEAALNSEAAARGVPVTAFVCEGMTHRRKEEKAETPLRGLLAKWRMLAVALGGYLGYRARRRWRQVPVEAPSGGS